jgi:hypothetical protein
MPNQKISELTAIVTVDNSVDVLPIVDISANTTKKVTPNALKTALALDNVNNTSDANKPVSIAQQDALNAKVDENAPITAGTAPKITYDAKGLVTSGDSLDETDLPTGINANKIGTGAVSSTEFGYLDGVTSAIQTQIDSKQATLVSGTNIKTINSTSLLGSGDIAISATPSGVSGAIQFSDGSAFASDAANFFWNNTTKRLGLGTNSPTQALDVIGAGRFYQTFGVNIPTLFAYNGRSQNDSTMRLENAGSGNLFFGGNGLLMDGSATFGQSNTALGARVGIKGSGSTSATTSLLVQNSAGTELFKVQDNGSGTFGFAVQAASLTATANINFGNIFYGNNFWSQNDGGTTIGQQAAPVASAILDIRSTTRGFLPPRMTTTQKNAITAVAGLVVYDSTTNKLQCYNGSTWNDLF